MCPPLPRPSQISQACRPHRTPPALFNKTHEKGISAPRGPGRAEILGLTEAAGRDEELSGERIGDLVGLYRHAGGALRDPIIHLGGDLLDSEELGRGRCFRYPNRRLR